MRTPSVRSIHNDRGKLKIHPDDVVDDDDAFMAYHQDDDKKAASSSSIRHRQMGRRKTTKLRRKHIIHHDYETDYKAYYHPVEMKPQTPSAKSADIVLQPADGDDTTKV